MLETCFFHHISGSISLYCCACSEANI